MSNFAHGREAEAAAAEYLKARGYEILAQNWRTRRCEIDIVAKKDRAVYCVEVKYRQNNFQGLGLDYITPKKLGQMEFAARMWAASSDWRGDIVLSAIEVAGETFEISEFIESVTG
jgi:Holliday junction resolvase-like predicted endonuclease